MKKFFVIASLLLSYIVTNAQKVNKDSVVADSDSDFRGAKWPGRFNQTFDGFKKEIVVGEKTYSYLYVFDSPISLDDYGDVVFPISFSNTTFPTITGWIARGGAWVHVTVPMVVFPVDVDSWTRIFGKNAKKVPHAIDKGSDIVYDIPIMVRVAQIGFINEAGQKDFEYRAYVQ